MIDILLLWSLPGLAAFYLGAMILGRRRDLRLGTVFSWVFVVICGPLCWLALIAWSQGYRAGLEDGVDAAAGDAPDFVVTELGEILAAKKGGPKL